MSGLHYSKLCHSLKNPRLCCALYLLSLRLLYINSFTNIFAVQPFFTWCIFIVYSCYSCTSPSWGCTWCVYESQCLDRNDTCKLGNVTNFQVGGLITFNGGLVYKFTIKTRSLARSFGLLSFSNRRFLHQYEQSFIIYADVGHNHVIS